MSDTTSVDLDAIKRTSPIHIMDDNGVAYCGVTRGFIFLKNADYLASLASGNNPLICHRCTSIRDGRDISQSIMDAA